MKARYLTACLALALSVSAPQRSFYQQSAYKGQEIGTLTRDGACALWLKAEMARRFNVPVKYVIYSHSHWDHASGGAVYADTARFIGHENMLKNIAMPPANTPLPQNVKAQDTNGNGKIEASEAQGAE